MIILMLLVYLGCAVLSYGIYFAYLQGQFPAMAEKEYAEDQKSALNVAFFGPCSLLVLIIGNKCKHGIKFK